MTAAPPPPAAPDAIARLLDDFNEQFKTDLPQEDYHTVAGFVFGQLGELPQRGQEVVHDGVLFRVEEVEGSRIGRLAVTFERRREQRANGELEDERHDEAASA